MIIITGDSWACGEWSVSAATTGGITHGGIAQLLQEQGHSVVNLGMPGNNNRDSLRRLRWFLQNNQHLAPSQVIAFKSDIARNINPPDIKRGYVDFRNATNHGFYFQLAEIARLFDIPCVVIGGSSDTVSNSIENLSECEGIRIGVESFTEFLLTGNSKTSTPIHSLWQEHDSVDQLDQIKNWSDAQDVSELLKDLELAETRLKVYESNKNVFPDSGHPGAIGHQMLLNFLFDNNFIK